VEQFSINNQFGSCYPKDVFSPDSYEPSVFFEHIYREQNRMLAAKQAKQKEAKAKEAVKAAAQANAPVSVVRQSSTGSGFTRPEGGGEPGAKKSKWGSGPTPSSGNAFTDLSTQIGKK